MVDATWITSHGTEEPDILKRLELTFAAFWVKLADKLEEVQPCKPKVTLPDVPSPSSCQRQATPKRKSVGKWRRRGQRFQPARNPARTHRARDGNLSERPPRHRWGYNRRHNTKKAPGGTPPPTAPTCRPTVSWESLL
ncbi:Hypothetical predicted protein [Pelobates cultripes]|uniref:Uncharacterized protein n=1 Tax=Pelobates cultripes TaxID=61616 RepID=A0AAD1QZV5_PELCU|nr:Hypothetical predicted protein [Pelobates cultripes]